MVRSLALLLSASLIVLSPGIAPYEAAAQEFTGRASGAAVPAPVVPAVRVSVPQAGLGVPAATLGASFNLPSFNKGVQAAARPAGELRPAAEIPAAAAFAAAGAAAVAPAAAAAAAAQAANLAPVASSRDRASVGALSASIGRALEKADLGHAAPSAAHATGAQLQDLLGGGRAAASSDGGVLAAQLANMGVFGAGEGPGLSYGKPAGRDSIVDAAEAYFGGASNVPAPPANAANAGNNGGNNGAGNGGSGDNGAPQSPKKAPLVPRLLSAALALAPAALLGWPLLTGGSVIAGALVILGSAGVAALPFMSERTPKLLRSLPGFVIAGLGVATLAGGVSTGALALSMGAVVTLGGWGFVRFARTTGNKYDSAQDLIAAFFGSLAAVTGAGLALLHPAGLVATVLTVAAYPTTLALYMYLPGWVGASLTSAVRGIDVSVRDSHAVLSSVRSDTVLAKRLTAYTSASLKASAWNAVWLGLVVWLPLVLVEGASSAVGVVLGLALGLVRAPVMLLWGASYKLAPQSGATRFFAGWARAAYRVNKPSLFNRFETPLVAYVNSDKKYVSLPAALGLRFLQAGFVVAAALWTPLAVLAGWIEGLREIDKPYDQTRHDPDYLSLGSDPLPAQVPAVDEPKVTTAWPGKLLATGIGLAPLALLGAPLLTLGVVGWGVTLAAALVGVMPVMPKSAKVSALVRRAPGSLLALTGFFAAFGAARYSLIGLPTGMILPLGLLALAGGLGLRALVDKLRDGKTEQWRLDQPEYIGGFASAVAITAAFGAALLGLTGPLAVALDIGAFALSPLLLYHLPKSLWRGVGAALAGLFSPIAKVWDVMGFWRDDARFNSNLNDWYRYWTRQSGWYAAMFLVPWALTLAAYAVEGAVSLAAGLLVGLARLPTNFAWGWAYEKNPEGRAAKFWTGFNQSLSGMVEGSKTTGFDPLVKPLIPAIEAKNAVSSRPTLKALAALTAARFVQLFWLARVVLGVALTPVLWLAAVRAGLRSDKAERPRRGVL